MLFSFYIFAFSVLMKDNSILVAIHEGKYYKRKNDLAVGPGFFTHGLEYVTGKSAIVLGKPNSHFFNLAIPEGIAPNECCMIGDVSLLFWNFEKKAIKNHYSFMEFSTGYK